MKSTLAFLFWLSIITIYSQDTLTVEYYNILWFPKKKETRFEDYKRIISHSKPDVLVLNELNDSIGDVLFYEKVLLPINSNYKRGYFHNSNNGRTGSDVAFYYNSKKLSLVEQSFIKSTPRDINGYKLFYNDIKDEDTVFFNFYSSHLKASQGEENAEKRYLTCKTLINHLESNKHDENVFFGGDFNFYKASEIGYDYLLNNDKYKLFDPIDKYGNWHDNQDYSLIHTQSTRKKGFGGGGLDDRFDFILISADIIENKNNVRYLKGSYKAIGNDGKHLDQDILYNSKYYSKDEKKLAKSLRNASDHLPVVMKVLINQ